MLNISFYPVAQTQEIMEGSSVTFIPKFALRKRKRIYSNYLISKR